MQSLFYKIASYVAFVLLLSGWYFFTQNKIETLSAELTQTSLMLEQTTTVIQEMQSQQLVQNVQINDYIEKLQIVQQDKDKLHKKFQKHNLEKLASKKPKLIEKKINDASKKILTDLGNITDY
ncbi:MAG: hypothetical protein HQ521_06660 [Bacteroidetes bacterium]|nr:hypothetical protein [Bacteroidota bacterium]